MAHPAEVAYHEAGHAVAAAVLGVEVLSVSVGRECGDAGQGRLLYTTSADPRDELLVALAGPAAVAVVRGGLYDADGSGGDLELARAAARRIGGDQPRLMA